MEQLQKQKITKMGNHAAEPKPETFREVKERTTFESIGRQLKNLLAVRLGSSDPSVRKMAEKWQEIIDAGMVAE